MTLTRRNALFGGAVLAAGLGLGLRHTALAQSMTSAAGNTKPHAYPVTHTDAEWHKLLTDDQFEVLRHAATEQPFTSSLLHETRKGRFACVGCGTEAFSSDTKFDSGTGWPSFYDAIPGSVDRDDDDSLGMERTAVSCAKCGGHLGHVFDDGPKPTGLRYCMNGVVLSFKPAVA